MVSKVASILVALFYLAMVYAYQDSSAVLDTLILLIIPLGCIWFSDEIGGTDSGLGEESSKKSAQKIVAAAGWLILLAPMLFKGISILTRK
ncbi:MAG TPA: hypothetical protein DCZ94_00815 [Lentisphaeria bacterium]|nr:MAG: hypothetical protein A2X48_11955 [Lentisphaerae bacterium GWF2_49_21]HBC85472.1 hypothetical protein [Lentisphaeria bacterium]